LTREAFENAIAVAADVSVKAEVDAMIAETVATFGRLDILVNNAGICPFHEFLTMPEELWDRVQDVNLKGVFLCSQAGANQMIAHGHGGSIPGEPGHGLCALIQSLSSHCLTERYNTGAQLIIRQFFERVDPGLNVPRRPAVAAIEQRLRRLDARNRRRRLVARDFGEHLDRLARVFLSERLQLACCPVGLARRPPGTRTSAAMRRHRVS
jgi:hypothetical protein